MKIHRGKIFILILILLAVNIYSCSEKNNKKESTGSSSKKAGEDKDKISSAGVKEGSVDFRVEYYSPRKIYKIEKEDLNGDGNREIVVLSVIKDSGSVSDYYNFDMMEIFSLDKSREKYEKIFSDTVDYSEECRFESLAGDSTRQILVYTNAGGNDKIMSSGMFVYGMDREGKVNLIKYFDSGLPEIKDLNKDNTKQILIKDEYWGVMPHTEVIYYTKEIYIYENGNLLQSNQTFGEYYDKVINELKPRYYGLKRKLDAGMQAVDLSYPLYREALEVIVNYTAKGDMNELRKFWNEESDYLEKHIPGDEYTDMRDFIFKVLPTAKNA